MRVSCGRGATPQGIIGGGVFALVAASTLFLADTRPASAEVWVTELEQFGAIGSREALLVPFCRVCPDSRVRFRELDAARSIETKLALRAAVGAASAQRPLKGATTFGTRGTDGRYVFANTPAEVAQVFRQAFGPSSLLAQSVGLAAGVVVAVEHTTQIPLDALNFVSDRAVAKGRELGLRNLPALRLRSRIENDRASVTLSARW